MQEKCECWQVLEEAIQCMEIMYDRLAVVTAGQSELVEAFNRAALRRDDSTVRNLTIGMYKSRMEELKDELEREREATAGLFRALQNLQAFYEADGFGHRKGVCVPPQTEGARVVSSEAGDAGGPPWDTSE